MNSILFGERIYRLRKEKNLTQAQLAEILGVSNKTVSRWETGEGFPEITILKRLATTLGVSVDELLSDENKSDEQSEHIFEDNFTKKSSKHENIPIHWSGLLSVFSKKFWNSLTIFNKISCICILLTFIAFIFSLLSFILYYVFTGDSLGTLPVIWSMLITIIFTKVPLVGLIAALAGLIAGFVGIYDKQTKGGLILLLICFIIKTTVPILIAIFSYNFYITF